MRIRPALGAVALAAVSAGCSIGSSSHSTLNYSQAVKQARTDGFVGVHREPSARYTCDGHQMSLGPTTLGAKDHGVRDSYGFSFNDRRAPVTHDTARITMFVVIFDKPGYAARCAVSGLYGFQHQLITSGNGSRSLQPTRRISADILFDRTTGTYDAWVARGDAVGLGQAGTLSDARLMSADLARLAAQISG